MKKVDYRKLLVKNKIAGIAQNLGVTTAWISRCYKKNIEATVAEMSDEDVFRHVMLIEEFGAGAYVQASVASVFSTESEQETSLNSMFSNVGVDGSLERQDDEGISDDLSAS